MSNLDNKAKLCADYLKLVCMVQAPKDTWNLTLKGIRVVWLGPEMDDYAVGIGGENAPYAVYTNEPWAKGHNPNEGWIERAISTALPGMKNIMSGTIKETELNDLFKKQSSDFKALKNNHVLDLKAKAERW